MAVFMINICKYNGCGITFPSLGVLIQHIEETHIEYDPSVLEQKESSPSCIPLSYVLRFVTEASRRELASLPVPAPAPAPAPPPPPPQERRRVFSAPRTPSLRSSTPTGSELDEEEMVFPSEDSNDSWTTVEEYSSDYILRYGVKQSAVGPHIPHPVLGHDKPFACPVPGCKKRYKNVNGIKYHSKNGHKKDGKIKKAYKCQCGKSYKTAPGLRSHSASHHPRSRTPPGPPVPRNTPGLVVTASNSHGRPDALDGNKLVRIYDSLKPKDLPSLTIPKQSLKSVDYTSQYLRNSMLTPTCTAGCNPGDKPRFDGTPVSVQMQPLLTPPGANESLYMPKLA